MEIDANEHDERDKCVIAKSSTHNEYIKRLWRDVHRSVPVSVCWAYAIVIIGFNNWITKHTVSTAHSTE